MASTSTTEMAIGVVISISAVFWMVFAVSGFNPFDAIPFGTEGSVMISTIVGLLGVYDLSAKAGLTCYPR